MRRIAHHPRGARAAALLLAGALSGPARAEVVLDGTLDPADAGRAIPSVGGTYTIGAGDGTGAEFAPNLFHSFQVFGVESGRTARFTAPAGSGITHVLARVTGGDVTRIDGRLRSEIEGASFWLMNPNGVLFGPDSDVSVPGAFVATTADEIRFGACPGCRFSASAPETSVLTVAEPTRFGFLRATPASIEVDRGTVGIPRGVGSAPAASLAFVAGDITIRGRGTASPIATGAGFVSSRGGRVELVAVAEPGEVALGPDGPDVSVGGFADIRLLDGATVSSSNVPPDGSGIEVVFGPDGLEVAGAAGDVFIRGGNLVVEDSAIRTSTAGDAPAGALEVALTGDLVISKTKPIAEVGLAAKTGIAPFVGGTGRGGDIRVRARNVSVTGGATVSSTSDSQGSGGRLDVVAQETLRVAGLDRTGAAVDTDVAIPGNRTLRSGLFGNAQGSEAGGSIVVRARDVVLEDHGAIVANTAGSGDAGTIDVAAERVSIAGNGRIDTSTRGTGVGGDIAVRASESIRITGASSDTEFSGITTLAQPESASGARGGTIRVTAPRVELRDGAVISARSVANAAGTAQGDAGAIVIEASDALLLSDASIATEAQAATGGNVTIQVRRLVDLLRSEITTSVRSGAAPGGNILIDPQFVILDASRIVAQADAGQGGNILIQIVDGALIQSPDSVISASAGPAGIDGTVRVDSPVVDLAGQLTTLPEAVLDAASLLRARCAARRGSAGGSFVVEGTAPLAPSPDAPLPSRAPARQRAERSTAAGAPRLAGVLTGGVRGPALFVPCPG